jgi:hypothetical protein
MTRQSGFQVAISTPDLPLKKIVGKVRSYNIPEIDNSKRKSLTLILLKVFKIVSIDTSCLKLEEPDWILVCLSIRNLPEI